MNLAITGIKGTGGTPPSQITVSGSTDCDRVWVSVSCFGEEVKAATPDAGRWSITFKNSKGCTCGELVKVTAACSKNMKGGTTVTRALECDPPPPPECCDKVKVTVVTQPVPSISGAGGAASVQFAATLEPRGCPGSFQWRVTNQSTGAVLQEYAPGSSTFSYAYSNPGTYEVAVKVEQTETCRAQVLTDAVSVKIVQCKPCTGGSFMDDCRLDLPKNDVVEAIEFERFVDLNLTFGALQDGDAQAPDNSAEFTKILSLPLAVYLPFRQEWKLCGYCRGRIVNSFTLGPEEEQTVDIFKWDRMTRSMESTSSFETEETTESSSTRRDTRDVARDITRQAGFETKSDGKVGFTVGVAKFDLNAGLSARTSLNETEKETRTAIMYATSRSTGRIRTSRTLKVAEGREYGQEMRITRRLKNANKCHTLTIAFFEILANYTVSTFVRGHAVRLVMLIDSANLSRLTAFDGRIVRAHERSLRLALLDSTLSDGFAAARYLAARERACAVLCEGCSCGVVEGDTAGAEWDNLAQAAAALAPLITTLRGRSTTAEALFVVAVPPLGLAAPLPPPAQTVAVTNVKRYIFFESLKRNAPQLLSGLAALGLTSTVTSITVSQVEAIARVLASVGADKLPKLLYDDPLSKDVGMKAYGIYLSVGLDPIIAAPISLGVFWSRCSGDYDDGGLVAALTTFAGRYESWKKARQAQLEKDEKERALRKIEKAEREARVLEAYPLRETADAEERLEALLVHLNENLDHYRFAVWSERSGGIDSTLINLARAGFIDPTPVGMVGDQLAVPLKLAAGSKAARFFEDSIADILGELGRTDQEHILPTPALYAEAIAGTCCSCEGTLERDTELDLARKELDNKLLDLEGQRLHARLVLNQLDAKAATPAIRVEVVKDGA